MPHVYFVLLRVICIHEFINKNYSFSNYLFLLSYSNSTFRKVIAEWSDRKAKRLNKICIPTSIINNIIKLRR